MSWYNREFTDALPFIETVFESREARQAGDTLFRGLAKKLDEVADDPAAVRALGVMIADNSDFLTGALFARTPAAGLLPPECMPPSSIDPAQDQVKVPPDVMGDNEGVPPAHDEEYEYDDSDEDEDDVEEADSDVKTKPKAKKKKKK